MRDQIFRSSSSPWNSTRYEHIRSLAMQRPSRPIKPAMEVQKIVIAFGNMSRLTVGDLLFSIYVHQYILSNNPKTPVEFIVYTPKITDKGYYMPLSKVREILEKYRITPIVKHDIDGDDVDTAFIIFQGLWERYLLETDRNGFDVHIYNDYLTDRVKGKPAFAFPRFVRQQLSIPAMENTYDGACFLPFRLPTAQPSSPEEVSVRSRPFTTSGGFNWDDLIDSVPPIKVALLYSIPQGRSLANDAELLKLKDQLELFLETYNVEVTSQRHTR